MISRILLAASAAIILFLGSVHLAYTMFTQNFSPTDRQLEIAMKHTQMVLSRQTTMWNAWIGFHFSHSIHRFAFVWADVWLPRHLPMGSAAQILFPGHPWIGFPVGLCCLGTSVLV